MAISNAKKVTVRTLHRMRAEKQPITMLTAYDYPFARLADEAGIDVILVGDSLGMTVLGYETTIPVTIADMLRHTAAVVRGVKRALVVADMPFLTYQISPEQALVNAGRFLQEAGAHGVKLEGGATMAPTIRKLTQSGIPVLAHIGILPQSVHGEGGYRIHGRTPPEARKLKDDAEAVADAGAWGVVLEGLPAPLAAAITERLNIPTIGIGAGPNCSGQVQVQHDILGLFQDFVPKHTHRYMELGTAVRDAFARFREDVRLGKFPGTESVVE